jgi:hypothetical protein
MRRGLLLAVLASAVAVILGVALVALRYRDEAPTGAAPGGAGRAGHGAGAGRGSGAVVRSVRSGSWTDRAVWGGRLPGTTDTARIAAGTTVSVDAGPSASPGSRWPAGARWPSTGNTAPPSSRPGTWSSKACWR